MIEIIIIAVTVVASFKAFSDETFFRKYEFHIGSIKAGEQIRLITSGFLHVDVAHLAFNMITFYFFAPVVYNYLGINYFLLIYFASILVGNLFSLQMYKNHYHYRAVGASGGVSGIIYSAIMLQPDMNLYLFFIPLPIPAYIFGIGYLLYSLYGMKAKIDNIGHTAHFGGAVTGFILTLLINPQLAIMYPKMTMLLTLPIIILFYMYKTKRIN